MPFLLTTLGCASLRARIARLPAEPRAAADSAAHIVSSRCSCLSQ